MVNFELKYLIVSKRIFITGGTFGHVYPAITLMKIKPADLYIEEKAVKFVKNHNFTLFSFDKTLNPFKIIKSAIYFWKKIRSYDEIYVFGGYSCLPAIIASVFTWRKKYFHEQNAILGKINKIALFLGFKPMLSFVSTKLPFFASPIYSGYFIDKPLRNIEEKILLVIPGSGGSDFFDEVISKKIQHFDGIIYFVAKDVEKVRNILPKAFVAKFFFNIEELLSKSTYILGRAGAGTIAKILLYRKKSLIIPLKNSANNHQCINAKESGIPYIEEDNIGNFHLGFFNYPSESKMILTIL